MDSENKTIEHACEDWLRLVLLKHYLMRLEASVNEDEIDKNKLSSNAMEKIVHSILLGSGSDR